MGESVDGADRAEKASRGREQRAAAAALLLFEKKSNGGWGFLPVRLADAVVVSMCIG